ncbi:MAG: flagellar brake domain-containing protein [Armatimonadetes bacterium]|nr:flagellar brake domain-containing protein [Armatimonadota bacterium]
MRRHAKRPRLDMPAHTKARLVGPQGVYRCYYLSTEKEGLVFSAPLQRDAYVPVRVGETFMAQIPTSDGVLTFRTEVVSRDAATHQFTVAHPSHVRRIERRSELRETVFDGIEAVLNGEPAVLCDLSKSGAKFVTHCDVTAGEEVTITLPDGKGTFEGWALESIPGAWGSAIGRIVRVRFSEPFHGVNTWARS